MLIKYKNNGVEKHVHADVGRGFIDAGLAVEVVAVVKPVPNVNFTAMRGDIIDDFEDSPRIVWKCSTCNRIGGMRGPTVHETQQAACNCGRTPVPTDVARAYVRMRKEWDGKKRHNRPPKPSFAVTDAKTLSHFGVKTQAQYDADYRALAQLAPPK